MPVRRERKRKPPSGPGPCTVCEGKKVVKRGRVTLLCPGCNGSGTTIPNPPPDPVDPR